MTTDENEPGTMTPIPTRRRLLGACAVGLSVVSAGCAGAMSSGDERTEFDRELDTDAGRVTVETDSGDARVRRTDADAIQVRGTKETGSAFTDLDDLTVETTRDSDHLRISADASGDSFLGLGGGSISLDVGAPEGIDVEAVSARNGYVTATDVAGDTRLESANGETTAHDVDGFVSLASASGAVSARGVAGLDGAETTNGDVTVESPAIDGDVSVSSMNGDAIAAMAPDLDATVVASASNGNLNADELPLDAGGRRKTKPPGDARRRHTRTRHRNDQRQRAALPAASIGLTRRSTTVRSAIGGGSTRQTPDSTAMGPQFVNPRRITRPSVPPSSARVARSGWGINTAT